MTNLAMAFLQEERLAANVRRMCLLGGNFVTPGNMTPLSEYNIWADAEAARIVLNQGVETILVPLDVCEDNRAAASMLTRRRHRRSRGGAGDHPVLQMIRDSFPIYIDIWREFFDLVGFPMDDIITVALAFDRSLCTTDGTASLPTSCSTAASRAARRSPIAGGSSCRVAGRRRRGSAPISTGGASCSCSRKPSRSIARPEDGR